MSDAAIPRIADRYTVLRTLGRGAFGRTLLVHDAQTGREVAMKMLDTQKVDSFKGFELFEREASVMRAVRHHGVPEIYDSLKAQWEGREAAFLVMEFIAGKSLEALIAERHHLDAAAASHILLELLGVLDYLHSRVPPILHRDIKPANIILRPDGYPTLVDFGAVRTALHAPGQDGSTIVGTYGYMPYEQHMGQATPASDLYALAATYLHLLTGRPPQEFMTPEGRIEVPTGLPGGERQREVLGRLLRPAPTERYQSAREVRQALLASEAAALSAPPSALALTNRAVPTLLQLPPAPRSLEGEAAERFEKLAPSMWRYMNSDGSLTGGGGPWGAVASIFLGLITFGVLPAIVAAKSGGRRRRLRNFLRHGIPTVAEITSIESEKDDLGIRLGRVRFQFQVDGVLHRDSDTVIQAVADRWRPGDQVEILYLPDHDHDGMIISTR